MNNRMQMKAYTDWHRRMHGALPRDRYTLQWLDCTVAAAALICAGALVIWWLT